ncbi:MAG TPA: helix-turn-helix domain-containing protein [Pseudonocardiaceae bacterium]
MRSFGELLRHYRGAAGLTQERLAERAGRSVDAVSALERGTRRHPHPATVAALSAALRLSGDQRAELEAAARTSSVAPRNPGARPRQLPGPAADFTGRVGEVEHLRRLLGGAPAVVTIHGMSGVGKTALALHAGHLMAHRFPDGQLYLNLGGSRTGGPVTVPEALDRLLRSLGAPAGEVPLELDAAACELRSMVAARQLLIVLDDAVAAEQVVPLLPGAGQSAVVVTSRRMLTTVPGAHRLRLDPLSAADALGLLAATAGRDRIEAEAVAATEVVRQCGRLPLALRMAGARLVARPHWPVAHLAERIADERGRLDEFDHERGGVRASFAVAIQQLATGEHPLDPPAAALFPALGMLDGPDLSLAVVARLLDVPEQLADRLLGRLVDVHLLDEHSVGRYRLHDLLRVYARERATATFTASDQAAALTRVLQLYHAVAWRSFALTHPTALRRPRHRLPDCAWMPDLPDAPSTLTWLDTERPQLVATVLQSARTPGVPDLLVADLALGLFGFCTTGRYWTDWTRILTSVLDLPEVAADPVRAAQLHNDLGIAYSELNLADDAVRHVRRGLDLWQTAADLSGQVCGLINVAHVLTRFDRFDEAIPVARRSLLLSRRLGAETRARCQLILGEAYRRTGRPLQALAQLRAARAGFEATSDTGGAAGAGGLAHALWELGLLHRDTGRPDDAERCLRQAVGLLARADPKRVPQVLAELDLLNAAIAEHDPASARDGEPQAGGTGAAIARS